MPEQDIIWYVAQLVGFIALLFGLKTFAEKSDQKFKQKMTFFCCVESVHFFLLGAYSACFGCLLNGLRSFASARTRSRIVMFFFLFFLWTVGLLSIAGFDFSLLAGVYETRGITGVLDILLRQKYRFLPLMGSTLGTVGLFCCSGITLRCMILICSFLWLIHNIIAVSIGPSIMEMTFIVMNSITIRKLWLARKKHG